jgi:SP family myo-inositol transporter-like MFS transporter 13
VLAAGFNLMATNSPPIVKQELYTGYDHCQQASSCDACISYSDCGYCFYENASRLNFDGSCLPVDKDSSDIALTGRCNKKLDVNEPLTWAYEYCPTDYAWLAIFGLVLYLIAFAPGESTFFF